jgi:hypothetical protein
LYAYAAPASELSGAYVQVITMNSDSYLDRRSAAEFLTEKGYKTAPATLAKLACTGGGPEFIKYRRHPIYKPIILLRWAESQARVRKNTSDPGVGLSTGPASLSGGL